MAPWRSALVVGALLLAGCGGGVTASAGAPHAGDPHTVAPAGFAGGNPHDRLAVRYVGPGTLEGLVVLRADVSDNTRVVAVTFMLAGRALGTVTRAPWALDVDAALLTPGVTRVDVAAVDRLGQRAGSPATTVRVLAGGERVLYASARSGLGAALRALAAGSATVRLLPGRYVTGEIVLGPGARLSGSGRATVLAPAAGGNESALLSTQSSHVRISDLAITGAGHLDDGMSIANASDVRVQRVEVSGVRVNGIAIGGTHSGVSVQDSVLEGGGAATGAGVFDDGSVQSSDTSVVRTRIDGFRGYGVLFAQRFHGLARAALRNLALDNDISDTIDPTRHNGTDGGGLWTGGVQAAVIGNLISGASTDGIETVGSSTFDTIVDNTLRDTPVAIYIEHSTNGSVVEANRAANVGTGINVEWRHNGGGSNADAFAYNRIAASEVGVFVDVQEDYDWIVGNVFTGAHATPVILQGSSHDVVRHNLACATDPTPFVVQQPARSQTGAIAMSSDNQVADNERSSPCTAA